MEDEIFDLIKDLYIECPDCSCVYDDDQYGCAICGCQGGRGRINVVQYLYENPKIMIRIKSGDINGRFS